MDPITGAIVAAAAAGLASAAGDVSKQAAVDAYNGLKAVIKRKFGGDSKISQAVTQVEDEPDFKPNQDVLAARVEQTGAQQDPDLQQLAQALRDALQEMPEGREALGKYQVDARGAQIGIIGDETRIEGGIHFGDKPETE